MSKLILMSMMIAMVAIPARAAADPVPENGFRRTIMYALAFEAFYTFAMIYLWGRW
jgi:hypothetical protein